MNPTRSIREVLPSGNHETALQKPQRIPEGSTPRQRVLWALEQGWSDPRAIATYTTLSLERTRTELLRLCDAGKAVKESLNCYKPKGCLLAETWK